MGAAHLSATQHRHLSEAQRNGAGARIGAGLFPLVCVHARKTLRCDQSHRPHFPPLRPSPTANPLWGCPAEGGFSCSALSFSLFERQPSLGRAVKRKGGYCRFFRTVQPESFFFNLFPLRLPYLQTVSLCLYGCL